MINSMSLIEKLRPKLIDQALAMRNTGSSYDAISRMLSAQSGVDVGREAVRKFLMTQAAEQGAPND